MNREPLVAGEVALTGRDQRQQMLLVDVEAGRLVVLGNERQVVDDVGACARDGQERASERRATPN